MPQKLIYIHHLSGISGPVKNEYSDQTRRIFPSQRE